MAMTKRGWSSRLPERAMPWACLKSWKARPWRSCRSSIHPVTSRAMAFAMTDLLDTSARATRWFGCQHMTSAAGQRLVHQYMRGIRFDGLWQYQVATPSGHKRWKLLPLDAGGAQAAWIPMAWGGA